MLPPLHSTHCTAGCLSPFSEMLYSNVTKKLVFPYKLTEVGTGNPAVIFVQISKTKKIFSITVAEAAGSRQQAAGSTAMVVNDVPELTSGQRTIWTLGNKIIVENVVTVFTHTVPYYTES